MKARDITIPLALYIVAATLLLFRIAAHPPFLYNWENYTAWGMLDFWEHPSAGILLPRQGLMTDSSNSALTILPSWLGFAFGGMGLTSLRVPVSLLAAGAVPLLWLIGRRLFGQRVALLAAVLLALSPVFLLYSRTATVVGISLVPALLTIYIMLRVLQNPRRWGWLIALQLLLLLGAYAYAPIRFLWLLSLGLLGVEWFWRKDTRNSLGIALAVTAAVLPAMLFIIQYSPGSDPVTTLAEYYDGRGEQIGTLTLNTKNYAYYLDLTPEERAAGKPSGSPAELALRLIVQNAANYAKLLLDLDTRPTITDYWNSQGRLYPMLLVPFFLLGLGYTAWRGRKREGLEYRVLVALFFGFGLPLLLTSRVHVGRLIYAVPLLMLLVALGFFLVADGLMRRAEKFFSRTTVSSPVTVLWHMVLPVMLTLILVAGVACLTWLDYSITPAPTHDSATVDALKSTLAEARASGGVALVVHRESTSVLEEINILPYRLDLDTTYRFIDLFKPNAKSATSALADPRPPLYLGDVLAHLEKPGTMPNYCNNLYYVDPTIEPQFLGLMKKRGLYCTSKLKYKLLP